VAQDAPETVILTEDEAGLCLQPTTMAVWALQGHTPVIQAHPGREKVNFYGTLNLHTGQEIVMRSETMNAETSAQHLRQILDAIPSGPILLLWDRAPWHRGQHVRDVLEANPRLEIIYFPVAAPELNPQEHVWKATRRAVSHNHTRPRLPELAERFEQYLVSNIFQSSMLERYGLDAICAMFK
jgi:transposase